MQKLQAALAVVLGTACTLLASASVLYVVVFYSGAYEDASIHLEQLHLSPALLNSQPILNNLLLILIFCCSHSLLARDWMKKLFSPVLSHSLYRQIYFLVSSLALFLVPYGWSPLPGRVWDIESPAIRLTLYGFQVCGAMLTVIAFFSVKPLEFCGLQDYIDLLMNTRGGHKSTTATTEEGGQLIVTGVYGLVRHPMYTGILVLLWSQPSMAQGQLLFVLVSTLYLFLVVPWLEERDLIRQFGHKYLTYIDTTGMFFPHPFTNRQKLE